MRAVILSYILTATSVATCAQTDSARPATVLAINAPELVNIIKGEPNLRIAVEQHIAGPVALFVESGIYFTGTGYNVRGGIKWYLPAGTLTHRPDAQRDNTRFYLGIDAFYKDHAYRPRVNFWTDSTHQHLEYKSFFVHKYVTTMHVLMGITASSSTHRLGLCYDVYWGLGIRFKEIAGVSADTYKMIESDFADIYYKPGIWPDVTIGVRLGLARHGHILPH